jgi:hypothetical protein
MTESGQRVAVAREQIVATIAQLGRNRTFDPQELIRIASNGLNVGAFQAAMQSLLATGTLEQAENWTVRMRTEPIVQ